MTIWKQQLLARYLAPAGDDGSDTGGTGTADVQQASATEQAAEALTAHDVDQGTASDGEEPAGGDGGERPDPRQRLAALLDEINGDARPAADAQHDAADKPQDDKAKDDEPQDAKAQQEPQPDAKAQPKPEADKEESELLEGVKSERGKERVRAVFQENKALKSEIEDFKRMVQSTGMTAEQFAQTLEFGRLVSSGSPQNLQMAVEMLERQRAALYAALGKEAPGVDLLADFPDLKERVDNLDMTRDAAVELAKHRRAEAQRRAVEQAGLQAQQRQQELKQTVSAAAAQMDAYLQTRAHEVDHPARMKALTERFQNPAFMQEFVSTYEPRQWAAAIKMMYESIQPAAAAAPRTADPQPLRARNRSLGSPAPAASASPLDRVASRLEAMGI